MGFLLVDDITEIAADAAQGVRHFPVGDPFAIQGPGGQPLITSAAVAEAIGQLASWRCLERNGFAAKPVFLFVERMACLHEVTPGSRVDLASRIEQQSDEVLCFSGEATVAGVRVMTIEKCHCALLPLEQLEEPLVVRRRFQELLAGPGRRAVGRGEPARPVDLGSLIDDVVEIKAGRSVVATKSLRGDEFFFEDHFPRMPVTPVVMLNEMVTTAAEFMGGQAGSLPLHGRLRVLRDLKIRRFVRPGDVCVVTAKVAPSSTPDQLLLVGEISLDGARIFRGTYEFDLSH